VLRHARELCAQFRIPPRQFRRRVRKGEAGYYSPASDIVAVDPDRAAMDGMGGEDGYYAMLMHELLHATGHPSRLNRATSGDYSIFGYDLEEGTVRTALRTVLKSIGFPPEALEWYAPGSHGLPVDWAAARRAAEWILTPQMEETEHCEDNWQWLWAAIVVPVALLVWRRWKRRRDEKTEKYGWPTT
jgi:hypothetical protein